MGTIAVLGMGLLGSGMAENLLAKSHEVRVWNRTASKCAPVVAQGAVQGETPADAVRGADRVHLVLSEDPAVDAVIGQLRDGLGAGVPILDHSTNLPRLVAARTERLWSEGVRYFHAPVFMAPSNAKSATGLMLTCGPRDALDALLPALQEMTGQVMYQGAGADRAAAIKLTGNGLLVMLTAAMGDLFEVGAGSGLTPQDVIALFETFRPTAAGMGHRILGAPGQPASFELTMARKDTRLMIETAAPGSLNVLPGIAEAMDRLIAEGRGREDFAVFAHPTVQGAR